MGQIGKMLLSLTLFFIGHIFSAILVYLNHRFVFHGKLGKLPILDKLRALHLEHHRHAYDDERNKHFEPLWVSASLLFIIVLIGKFVSLPFGLGLLSFAFLYAYRHKRIHNEDTTSRFSIHHRHHHTRNARKNFSGVYPVVDKIFGTFVSSL